MNPSDFDQITRYSLSVFPKISVRFETRVTAFPALSLFMVLHKFKDFDSFYEALLPAEKAVCKRLRDLILENFPEVREKFGYGVPYYHRFSCICFMYPASFPYSGHSDGVALGFTRGHLLSNDQGLLDMGDRKEVGYVLLRQTGDIRESPLLDMLHEAVLLDEDVFREKQMKKKLST